MAEERSIKALLRRAALAYLERREDRRSEPRKIVWLLAHMRSGSTLLMHLLSSHPDVLGAGERNATYASEADLRHLAIATAYARRQLFSSQGHVVDQINHNRFLTATDLLDHPRVYKIFLIREPRGALASMIEVLGRHYGMTREEATEYYLDRLPALASYARRARDKQRSFFLTYDDLVERSGPVLARLQAFLELSTPLAESYRTFRFTGRHGDPSQRIRSGRISSDLPPRPLEMEAHELERIREVYAESTRVLEKHCRHLKDGDGHGT